MKDDVAVAGGGAAVRTVGERLRLVEKRREQDAVGRAQVDHVENVVGAGNKGEIEAARRGGIQANGCATAAEPAAAYIAVFAWIVGLAFAGLFDARPDSDYFADANVKNGIGRPQSDTIWNQRLIFTDGIGVEAAVLRADNI